MMSTAVFAQPGEAVLLEAAQPFAHGANGGSEPACRELDTALTSGLD
jgi:hypothetical protein